jgi:hypothetical protein
MRFRLACFVGLGCVVLFAGGCAARAAAVVPQVVICGDSIPLPEVLPPAGSGPVVLMALPCAVSLSSGEESVPEAYRRYVELEPSRPADRVWVPYDSDTMNTIQADFRRLFDTGRLDDLTIEVIDYEFANGVVGKFVTYRLTER